MWNGILSPNMVKHHLRATIMERVRVGIDPITEETFDAPRWYWKVAVWWPPLTQRYIYLIAEPVVAEAASEENEGAEGYQTQKEEIEAIVGEELSEKKVVAILNAVKEYTENRLEYARDWEDYLWYEDEFNEDLLE